MDSTPRADRLKASNAYLTFSTATATSPIYGFGLIVSDGASQITILNHYYNQTVETARFADDTVIDLTGGFEMTGTASADTISGTNRDDTIERLAGNDSVNAFDGADSVSGGACDGTASGGSGDDRVDGGEGNDTVSGNTGVDTLVGGAGNDYLSGSENNDVYEFAAGWGNDTIYEALNSASSAADSLDLSFLSSTEVTFTRPVGSNNLVVSDGLGNDITILNHYAGYSVETAIFDGLTIDLLLV